MEMEKGNMAVREVFQFVINLYLFLLPFTQRSSNASDDRQLTDRSAIPTLFVTSLSVTGDVTETVENRDFQLAVRFEINRCSLRIRYCCYCYCCYCYCCYCYCCYCYCCYCYCCYCYCCYCCYCYCCYCYCRYCYCRYCYCCYCYCCYCYCCYCYCCYCYCRYCYCCYSCYSCYCYCCYC
jgi:hypothetical protein